MQYIAYSQFEQIKRYFHVSLPSPEPLLAKDWYIKLSLLFEILCQRFKDYYIPAQNVSVDEMMVQFTGRSKDTIKTPKKPISEGYKLWALCSAGYTWDFLWHSKNSGKLYNAFLYQ